MIISLQVTFKLNKFHHTAVPVATWNYCTDSKRLIKVLWDSINSLTCAHICSAEMKRISPIILNNWRGKKPLKCSSRCSNRECDLGIWIELGSESQLNGSNNMILQANWLAKKDKKKEKKDKCSHSRWAINAISINQTGKDSNKFLYMEDIFEWRAWSSVWTNPVTLMIIAKNYRCCISWPWRRRRYRRRVT